MTTDLIFKIPKNPSNQCIIEFWEPNVDKPSLILSESSIETLIHRIASKLKTTNVFNSDIVNFLTSMVEKHKRLYYSLKNDPYNHPVGRICQQIKEIASIICSTDQPSVEPSSPEVEPSQPLQLLFEEYKKKLDELENVLRSEDHLKILKYKKLFKFLQSQLLQDKIIKKIILRHLSEFDKILTPSSASSVSEPLAEPQASFSIYAEKIELLEKFLKDHFHNDIPKAEIFNKIILAHKNVLTFLHGSLPPGIDAFCITEVISKCVKDIDITLSESSATEISDPREYIFELLLDEYNIEILLLEQFVQLEQRRSDKINSLLCNISNDLKSLQKKVSIFADSIEKKTLNSDQITMLAKAFSLLSFNSYEIIETASMVVETFLAEEYSRIIGRFHLP